MRHWRLAGVVISLGAAVGCSASSVPAAAPVVAATSNAASGSPTPAPQYVPPRPVGPPFFVPNRPNPPLPNSPNLAFEMSVAPRDGLTLGGILTVTLRLTNLDARRVTGVGAAVNIGDGAVVAVVAAQGGQPDRVCDGHDVSPDTPPCRDYGVGWRGLTIAPHGVVTRSLTVKVVDFACRGGGDFQHLVYGTIVGPVRRGFNGGTYRVWYQNDAEDLVRATGSRTVLDAARGARGQCVSESVE